jgi:hypothetical protein
MKEEVARVREIRNVRKSGWKKLKGRIIQNSYCFGRSRHRHEKYVQMDCAGLD